MIKYETYIKPNQNYPNSTETWQFLSVPDAFIRDVLRGVVAGAETQHQHHGLRLDRGEDRAPRRELQISRTLDISIPTPIIIWISTFTLQQVNESPENLKYLWYPELEIYGLETFGRQRVLKEMSGVRIMKNKTINYELGCVQSRFRWRILSTTDVTVSGWRSLARWCLTTTLWTTSSASSKLEAVSF